MPPPLRIPPRGPFFFLLLVLLASDLARGARPSPPAFVAPAVRPGRGPVAPLSEGGGRGRVGAATLRRPECIWGSPVRRRGLVRTPLAPVTRRRSLACAMGEGAADGVDEWGRTALQVAVKEGDSERARALLEGGAAVDVASVEGDSTTPLHTAAMRGNKELVLLLLEFGADKLKKDDFGSTAWDVAKEEGHRHLLSDLKPPLQPAADPEPVFKKKSDSVVMSNNDRYTQEEAEAIMEQRADWRAAEAGRESSENSLLQMVKDPDTGEMFVRRVPLKE